MSRSKNTTKARFRKDKTEGMYRGWGVRQEWMKERLHPIFRSYPKLTKEWDYETHWMSTPSLWTNIMMNRPMRRKLKTKLDSLNNSWYNSDLEELLEEFDEEEGYSKKPHVYYW